MGRRRSSPVNVLFQWVRRQSMKVKVFLGSLLALIITTFSLPLKPCMSSGSSSSFTSSLPRRLAPTQELTALFLAVRLFCGTMMEADIHTVLDFSTLVSTAWVIYMIRFKLKSTYIKELDNFHLYFVVVPAAILGVLVHPYTLYNPIGRILWAFGGYMEAVSVLPQLRLMKNAKMIEPFTSHYVFALGISRFLACAHWIIRVSHDLLVGSGYFWILAAFLSEMVQTFILADFCYYYIKSKMEGQLIMRMPPV
ncbi:unnamed protein product [Malus baccata var. baccata]